MKLIPKEMIKEIVALFKNDVENENENEYTTDERRRLNLQTDYYKVHLEYLLERF